MNFEIENQFDIHFLSPQEIEKYFGQGFNDITPDQTKELILKQVDCLCVFEKKTEKIAAYSWFTANSISTGNYNLDIHFDQRYIYTLKVYTAPEFRGQLWPCVQAGNAGAGSGREPDQSRRNAKDVAPAQIESVVSLRNIKDTFGHG